MQVFRKKQINSSIFAILLIPVCFNLVANAEAPATTPAASGTPAAEVDGTYTCKSEIKYSWNPSSSGAAGGKDIEISFALAETNGKSEAEAQNALAQRVATERANASNRCRHEHENLAGCISTKYASMASILNALSFAARGELEKAIAEDCGKQTGRCVSSASSTPECRFTVAPTPTPDAKAAAADKGKKKK